jgi:hypothetical protein
VSSDDGFVIHVNNQGKYVLHHWQGDFCPNPNSSSIGDFDTLEEAVRKYAEIDSGDYPSEYRLTVNLSNEKETRMQTKKYARKAFFVEAVQVTAENMDEVAQWAEGTIQEDPEQSGSGPVKFIEINVHRPLNDRQRKAYVGDWVLSAGTGFKVYTNKAFLSSFEIANQTHNVFEEATA